VSASWVDLAYLAASVLFIFGLIDLAHPRTAVRGNRLGALGMLIAIVATAVDRQMLGAGSGAWMLILLAMAVGSVAGALLALRVPMTAMPQMVALLNGFGGGASVLVAGAALHDALAPSAELTIATVASGIIGSVTFWGSLVAFDKLQEFLLPGKPIHFPLQQPLNVVVGALALAIGVWIVVEPSALYAYWALVVVSSVLGVLLTISIGGADMPVAIALLNSYSGLAAAATGFVLQNHVLIIAGSLVGASGIILTRIMCRAMNRSLMAVLTGAIGPGGEGTASASDVYTGRVKSAAPEEPQ
jgi:NAD(P) transhydrogenase subunit beta